ncbi:MAG TPA: hypothetical protein GX500_07305 [Firmicutes bacterium]|nr:hypothetical protein [Candidatus Fermentithermobacillaceae bacterium]
MSGSSRKRVYLWALMGIAGLIILLVSLPPWVILALLGLALIAGAYYGYKSGL